MICLIFIIFAPEKVQFLLKTMDIQLSVFVKTMRKEHGLTQEDLAAKAGVGLRFVRELEQGKQTLRMDKVNQVLGLFGHEVGAVPLGHE